MRTWLAGLMLMVVALAPVPALAQLSSSDRNVAKTMTAGTLYLRIDVPCRYEVGGWGLGVSPLLEVSPTGWDVQRLLTERPERDRETIYWGFGPNDAVRYGTLKYMGATVELWMEGMPPNNFEVMLHFVNIKTLDDFKKAFDQTFSKVPLQHDHPEWPAEVRAAIASRKVIAGMTKEQAFCVVGTPLNAVSSEEGGKKVDTWFPRQERGTVITFRRFRSPRTEFPALLKFADNRLEVIQEASKPVDIKK